MISSVREWEHCHSLVNFGDRKVNSRDFTRVVIWQGKLKRDIVSQKRWKMSWSDKWFEAWHSVSNTMEDVVIWQGKLKRDIVSQMHWKMLWSDKGNWSVPQCLKYTGRYCILRKYTERCPKLRQHLTASLCSQAIDLTEAHIYSAFQWNVCARAVLFVFMLRPCCLFQEDRLGSTFGDVLTLMGRLCSTLCMSPWYLLNTLFEPVDSRHLKNSF